MQLFKPSFDSLTLDDSVKQFKVLQDAFKLIQSSVIYHLKNESIYGLHDKIDEDNSLFNIKKPIDVFTENRLFIIEGKLIHAYCINDKLYFSHSSLIDNVLHIHYIASYLGDQRRYDSSLKQIRYCEEIYKEKYYASLNDIHQDYIDLKCILFLLNQYNVIEINANTLNKHHPSDVPKPLYSEYILDINTPKIVYTDNQLGGSHASPREHYRREHIRRYKSGKVVTVKGHIINQGSEAGKIYKEYQLA